MDSAIRQNTRKTWAEAYPYTFTCSQSSDSNDLRWYCDNNYSFEVIDTCTLRKQ